jgi:thiamine biosynthesis protein ThiS
VVLHDARLHHARARRLLRPGGRSAYREEFRFNHPEVAPDLAELAVHGFDGPYYADWGEGRPKPVDDTARTRFRDRLGAGPDSLVFGVFGGLSPDKRVEAIFDAFAALRRQHPSAHLWLGGSADPRLDLPALLSRHQLEDAVTHLDDPDDEAFDQAIAAVDVSLNLRWPSALETSGPWLRALAAARPTIVIELAHQTDVPAWDPRDWRPRNPLDARQPATIAIDILDERHSLGLAMDRLAPRLLGGRPHAQPHGRRLRPPASPSHGSADSGRRSPACVAARSLAQHAGTGRVVWHNSMRITLNGDPTDLPGPLSVQALLDRLGIDGRIVAVERNLTVVRRAKYDETMIGEGDEIEIVRFVGGG